ncbi:ATP-dependent helicase [Micropruina sp.]|uniref:ATP-dependent helicase n=1 Tax=Micropruina sp. TaxID=2737536 RepID=UPI0039E54F80
MERIGELPPSWGLSGQQRAAVEGFRSGPVLVVGPPGSGKTTVVAAAAALELGSRPVDGAEPLVLTFSRRAASELRNTVARAMNRTVSPPWVTTLHAFCLWLLRLAAEPGQPEPRLLTAPEQEFRVRELLTGRGALAWPADTRQAIGTRAFARQVRGAIARVRQLGLDPDDVVAFGAAAGRPEWVSAGHFFAEYLDVLDHEGSLDYAELVHRARIALTDAELVRVVRARVSRVIVDEYGELDPAQIGLLRALVPTGGPILAVGDPDQVVFRFRGAHPRALAEFGSTFATAMGEPAPVVVLHGSHRASAAVADAVGRVARRLPLPVLGDEAASALRPVPVGGPARGGEPGQRGEPGLGGVSGPGSEPGPQVQAVVCASESEQAQLIAEQLRRAHLDDGFEHGDLAVLVRSGRRQIAPIARALVAAGIPVEVAGDEIPLLAEPAVRPLLLALEVVLRGAELDADEAKRLLTSPLAQLDAVGLRSLGRLLLDAERAATGSAIVGRSPGQLIADALSEPERLAGLPDTPEVGAVRALAGLLGAAGRALAVPGNGAAEVLWTLWSGTDWGQRLRRSSRDGGEAGRRADRDLDAVIALFAAAAATEQPAGTGGVRGFLAEVAAQEIPADTTREAEVRGRGVRLLTAHRAKGLEWAVVVVAGVQEGLWPAPGQGGAILDPGELVSDGLIGRPDLRESLADERRLFHLACSRARQRLIVTAVQGSDGEANQPSRFIAELGVPVTEYTPSARPLTLPALVAQLRRRATSVECSAALREAAALRLARLAALTDAHGRPLAAEAQPARWWGLAEPTGGARPAAAPVRLSPSSLTALLTCPRQHYLTRQVRADPPRNANASLGSVIHVLAEHARNDDLTLAELTDQLDEVWSQLPFDAAWLSQAERANAEDALARFVNWQQHNLHADVLGVEVAFDVQLDLDGTPVQLVGTVDRLERAADGRLRVVDFKTNKRAITAAAVAAHEQLGVYQLAIEAGGFASLAGPGASSAGASLVFLRLPAGNDLDDYPKEYHQAALSERPHLADDDAEHPSWVHERLARAVAIVRQGSYPATPGAGCGHCPFQASCPAKPSGRQVVG